MSECELIKNLREYAEWADANIWEVPLMLPDYLRQAADLIEEQQKRLEELRRKNDFLIGRA